MANQVPARVRAVVAGELQVESFSPLRRPAGPPPTVADRLAQLSELTAESGQAHPGADHPDKSLQRGASPPQTTAEECDRLQN